MRKRGGGLFASLKSRIVRQMLASSSGLIQTTPAYLVGVVRFIKNALPNMVGRSSLIYNLGSGSAWGIRTPDLILERDAS